MAHKGVRYPFETPEPKDNFIVCGSGRLQHLGDAEQGVPALASELDERFGHIARIELRRWDEDGDDLAEWIFRRCSSPENITLMAVGYSWGVGFWLKTFARACRKRGITINGAVLCDGVFHLGGRVSHRIGLSQISAFWPPRFVKNVPLPMFSKPYYFWKPVLRPRLFLPDNIDKENTHWFVQENSRLRGHNIYWEDTREMAANKTVIKFRNHTYMDECTEFRETTLDVAYKLFPNAGRTAA